MYCDYISCFLKRFWFKNTGAFGSVDFPHLKPPSNAQVTEPKMCIEIARYITTHFLKKDEIQLTSLVAQLMTHTYAVNVVVLLLNNMARYIGAGSSKLLLEACPPPLHVRNLFSEEPVLYLARNRSWKFQFEVLNLQKLKWYARLLDMVARCTTSLSRLPNPNACWIRTGAHLLSSDEWVVTTFPRYLWHVFWNPTHVVR